MHEPGPTARRVGPAGTRDASGPTAADRASPRAIRDTTGAMWWLMLAAGVAGVVYGVAQLMRTFRGGLRDRDVAQTDPALKLVRPALFVTFGLFLAFFGVANLIAARA